MPVSDSLKCVLIHIPKNAGTSIGLSMGLNYGGGHLTATQLKNDGYLHWSGHHDPKKLIQTSIPDWEGYFKFAIVRNPFDRVWSNYNYIKQKESFWHTISPPNRNNCPVWGESIHPPKGIHPEYHSTINKDFKTVVREIPGRIKTGWGWKHQHPFITDGNGKIMVDYICKQETLQEDMNVVCDKIGASRVTLKAVNKSNNQDYKSQYDEETIDIVRKTYQRDLELFGYDF
jgi:hypothetical protein